MTTKSAYFEQERQKELPYLENLVAQNDMFFIDTCSVMSPYIAKFAVNIIPLLKKYDKKLVLCSSVLRELKMLTKPTGEVSNISREVYAYMGLYTLDKFIENGVLDYVDDKIEDGPADLAFQQLFISMRSKVKMLLITQDANLTSTLLSFNQDRAVSARAVDVRLININGFLELRSQYRSSDAQRGRVRLPSVPARQTRQPKQAQPASDALPSEEKEEPIVQIHEAEQTETTSQKGHTKKQLCGSFTEKDAKQYVHEGKLHIPAGYTSIGFVNRPEITAVYVPDSVTSVNSQAFRDCTMLSRVVLPNTVETLGQSAFLNCKSLLSITLPNGVTQISNGLFKNCTKLRTVVMHNGISSIGSSAFCGCSSLTLMAIPYSVTAISSNAFVGCPNLVIGCYENSFAHRFAVENKLPYEFIVS